MMDYRNFSMLDLFRAEIEGQARILADGLVELEQNPVAEDYLEALMRAAHSIKGAARMVDVEPVVRISHVMEDCFVAAQNGKIVLASEDIDCLLKGVDMISSIARGDENEMAIWMDQHGEELKPLVASLSAIPKSHPSRQLNQPINL